MVFPKNEHFKFDPKRYTIFPYSLKKLGMNPKRPETVASSGSKHLPKSILSLYITIVASGLRESKRPFSMEPDNAIHAVFEMCFTEESKVILNAFKSTYIPSIIVTLIRAGRNFLFCLFF